MAAQTTPADVRHAACGRPAERQESRIAAPAPHRAPTEDPPVDPAAVRRAFALHRAKRRARIEHERELRRARLRFFVLLGGLVFLALFLSLSIWEKIQAVFGL
jgi:hypothetical protein